MSNVSKKVLSVGVVFSTMFWSVGAAALLPVAASAQTCQTFGAGDMVQAQGQRAIYTVDSNGKLLYFPSGDEFKSWNSNDLYQNFSVVSQACFDALYNSAAPSVAPYGVNFRPGSVVVKRPSSAQLYVVLPGNTLQKITQSAAQALYGSSFKAVTVADVFWPNYKVSANAEITEGKVHPGMLVKNGGKTWYVDSDSQLREVTSTGFTANRFKNAYVRTVADSAVAGLQQGAVIDALVASVADRTQTGGTGGVVTPVGGNVSVSLAANTPASATIISDSSNGENPQANIAFTSVNFTAGSSAAQVNTVKFTRTGIATDGDLGNMYLYDGNMLIAEYSAFNDKVVTFSNSNGLFTVPAGSTKTLTLRGDLARSSTFVASGKTIGFAINAASDVVLSSGTTGGSFPVAGNLMTTTNVSDLGHVYLTNYTSYPSSIKADDANKELWRFTATADSQDMQIRKVKMTLVGTVAASDIKDLKLEVAGVQVGATQQLSADKTITFDLSSAPVSINAGQSKIIVLRGSMNGGSGRVFKFSIQKSGDLNVFDTDYGVEVTPNITNATTAFTLVQPTTGNGTSVDSGTLTLGVATDSPTGNIADSGTGLTLAKFNFSAAGEAVKIDNLTVKCASGDSTTYLANVKLLLDGSQIGSTDTSLKCDNGTDTTQFTFGNTFTIQSGQSRSITVVADTTDASVASGDTVSVSLNAGSSNATGQTTFSAISTTAQTARTLTVKSGAVTVAKNSAFADRSASNPTGAVNATNVRIGSFIVTAGSGEAVDVTQFALKDDSTTQLGDNFQNLKLMQGSTQVGSTISSLNTTAGTYTFTPASAIRVAAGQQLVVDVYADVKSSVQDSATTLSPVAAVDSVTATGVSTSQDASYTTDVNLQAAYIAAAGSLSVSLDSDSPSAGQIVMGETDATLARFKLTANATEDLQLTDLILSNSTTATGTLKNVKLFIDGKQLGQAVNFSATDSTTTYANASFSGLTYADGSSVVIPRNTTKVLVVKGDVTSYDDGGSSGSTHQLALLANSGSGVAAISAKGVSAGTSITGPSSNVVAAQQKAFRTKISVAFASDSPNGSAVGGSGAIVAKVVVSNSANVGNYDATIESLNLTLSQTGISNTAARTLTIYKDSVSASNQVATTSFTASQNFGDTAITDASFTDVTITAGSSKTFIVTLDTSDASTNDKLSVNVGADDVEWGDGSSTSITEVPGSLPLLPKTLSY